MNRMKRAAAWLLALVTALALLSQTALAEAYTDGVYEAAAPGMYGDVTVRIAILDGEIVKISADDTESEDVGKPAIDAMIDRAMAIQGPDVDAVAGATETSKAFKRALKDALIQAGWVEEELPEIEIIVRRTPTPEPTPESTPLPVAEISAPEIGFNGVQAVQDGVTQVSGDIIVMNWHAEGDVQLYHIVVEDAGGGQIKGFDTTDGQGAVEAKLLDFEGTYTVTVTAVPRNGTLEADGRSTSAQFALYAAPTPEPVLQTGEISDSWEQIIAAIDDGSARQRYAVGATKALELGELGTVHMQLAGFDLDDRADGNGKASTTWIAVELLPDAHVLKSQWVYEGCWQDSDLRAYLQNTVLPAMQPNIGERLIWVKKTQKRQDGNIQFTEDRIWIPDSSEIFGEDALYYDLFQDSDANRIKTRNGSAAWWWLRSANSDYGASIVLGDGRNNNNYVGYGGGVAVAFCL